MTAQIGAPMWLDLQSMYANLRRWVEQIVHIDEVTGSSFVATARKAWLIACTLRTDTENRPRPLKKSACCEMLNNHECKYAFLLDY